MSAWPLPLWPDPDELDEINLDFAATTPALVAAVEAVQAAIPWYGSLHRGGGRKSAYSTTLFEESRAAVARFVGCDNADDVVFVRNTTEAANLLAVALPPGTRVLCSPFEHHANLLPLASAPRDASSVHDDRRRAASPRRRTRSRRPSAPAIRSRSSRSPAPRTSPARCRRSPRSPASHTSEARSSSSMPRSSHRTAAIDLHELGGRLPRVLGRTRSTRRSAPACSSRRRTGSPTGRRCLHGGGAVRIVTLDGVAWAETPRRYEAGTPNLLGAVALGAACDALTSYGMDVVAEDERLLGRRCSGTGSTRSPASRSSTSGPMRPIESASPRSRLQGWEAHELGTHLADRGIAVRAGSFCAHPFVAHLLGVESTRTAWLLHEAECGEDVTIPGAVRASIGLATTRADVDALLRAVAEAAAVAAA